MASAKNGVMKLYKAETADIVVEEGSLSNGAGLAVTVKAAATKKLTLSAPSEATAGSAFSVTLTATDEYGNPTTSYTGEKTLAWSGPASFSRRACARISRLSHDGHVHERSGHGERNRPLRRRRHRYAHGQRRERRERQRLHRGQGGCRQDAGLHGTRRTDRRHRFQRNADGPRRIRQHRHGLCGRKDASLERPVELAQRAGAQLPRDGHLQRRRGHGLDHPLRRPGHRARGQGRHPRRHLGHLHGQGGGSQKVHRAGAVRTGSRRRVQRDAHRHRHMGKHRQELYRQQDDHLERPGELAQRTGSELHDDDHFHRRRRRGLRDQTI